jgi:septum site-determining protein minC
VKTDNMQKNAESVRLKSQNSQFILYVNCNSFDDAVQSIDKIFSNKKELKKITVNRIEAPTLTSEDIEKIIEYLQEKLGIKYKEKKEEKRINEEPQESMQEIKTVKPEKLTDVDSISSQITEESEYKTKIIKNNLRSGASISYDGNILVIGDVNAGAELVATGHIIVIGVLRGFANAGVKGDMNAMVISNKINATQLRIGQFIAIPPKDDEKKTTGVQIASIQNNRIEIQQY